MRDILSLAIAASLAACAPPSPHHELIPPVDSDGDGLTDNEEHFLGLDVGNTDSDGDGFSDGDEVHGYTDPLDPEDRPYLGGWARGACHDDVQTTGYGIGDITPDFALTDQFGDELHLHHFCDRSVVLVTMTMWYSNRVSLDSFQQWFDAHASDGLMVIALMGENDRGETPSEGDVRDWVDATAATFPVVTDPEFATLLRYIEDPNFYIPHTNLIGPGAEVLEVDGYVELDDALAALY